MQPVPLQPVPNQTLQVVLANQSCQIVVYQTPNGIFMDVSVNDTPVVAGIICQNLNRIVRGLYLGFVGDFCFFDTQGEVDPEYSGLGSRYILFYLSASDVAGAG
jgi:hypothetical protein